MGIMDSLFNRVPGMPDFSQTASVLPEKAVRLINQGILPEIHTNSILLSAHEQCCYVDKAYMIHRTIAHRRKGSSSGVSFRVAKGITYRTGGFESVPVKEEQVEYIKGYFYITTRRIIFVSRNRGFEERIDRLTAILPYSNGIGLQFKNKTAQFLVPTPNLAYQVVQQLH